MKNVGGRPGGSITAAQFIQRFVQGKPWAHLDIAGTAWSSKDTATVPKGATAYGVRMLDRLVAEHYEGEAAGRGGGEPRGMIDIRFLRRGVPARRRPACTPWPRGPRRRACSMPRPAAARFTGAAGQPARPAGQSAAHRRGARRRTAAARLRDRRCRRAAGGRAEEEVVLSGDGHAAEAIAHLAAGAALGAWHSRHASQPRHPEAPTPSGECTHPTRMRRRPPSRASHPASPAACWRGT